LRISCTRVLEKNQTIPSPALRRMNAKILKGENKIFLRRPIKINIVFEYKVEELEL
jgi:hypothetical protein